MKMKILGNAKLALATALFGVPVGASIICALYMLSTKISPWIGVVVFVGIVGYIIEK